MSQDRVGGVPNGLRSAVPAPVGVRRVDGVYPGRSRAQRVRVVRGGGRHGVRGVGPAVIRLPYRHHVLVPGSHQGQPQGQVDRLGSRVDQEHGIERRGQQAGQPLGELHHRGVVEPGVGVQPPQLPGHRGLHPRVRVAEHGHVVHHVQVDPAVGGGQVVPPAPLDPRRVGVVVLLHRGERRRAPPQQVLLRSPRSRGNPSSGPGSATSDSQPAAYSGRTSGGTSGAPSAGRLTCTRFPSPRTVSWAGSSTGAAVHRSIPVATVAGETSGEHP